MIVLSTVAGLITWTLVEYLLHRFLGHVHKGSNFFKKEHVKHHSTPNYFASFYMKGALALLVSLILFTLLSLFLSHLVSFFFTLGFTGMYSIYELTHYRYHAKQPVPFFINFRKHHYYHHYHNPQMNHGVTSRMWDRVFGTYVSSTDTVKVPKRMAPTWMMNEDNTSVRSKYEAHFKVVGK
jgi:sterol desaturase/sphingolipid hydroxylase (fatty acid hydroxylase superfamily)